MDFSHAVKTLDHVLIEKQPDTFNAGWVRSNAPHVYRFIQQNVRADIGGIDWDRVTRALDRRFQKRWRSSLKTRRPYRKKS